MLGLPWSFCWTKYGVEAGEPVTSILERKDRERALDNGIFLWGIGNSIGRSVLALITEQAEPQVLFSPMLSRPAQRDVSPPRIVTWRGAADLQGQRHELPRHAVVTSRYSPHRRSHYALVCYSEAPLRLTASSAQLSVGALRNIVSGASVGSSQVTAVVRRVHLGSGSGGRPYSVAMRARLVPPYFVRLFEPADVTTPSRAIA